MATTRKKPLSTTTITASRHPLSRSTKTVAQTSIKKHYRRVQKLRTFHPFKNLPTELRRLVWGYAAPPPAVVTKYPRVAKKARGNGVALKENRKKSAMLAVPALLHVCKEGRYLYLDDSRGPEYSGMKSKAELDREREIMANKLSHPVYRACHFSRVGMSNEVYFSFEHDTLFGVSYENFNRRDIGRVKHLVAGLIDLYHFSTNLPMLPFFPALKDMTVIMNEPALLWHFQRILPAFVGNVVPESFKQTLLTDIREGMGDRRDKDDIDPFEDVVGGVRFRQRGWKYMQGEWKAKFELPKTWLDDTFEDGMDVYTRA